MQSLQELLDYSVLKNPTFHIAAWEASVAAKT